MLLDLKFDGSVEPFVNYLKNFSKIRTSLLLEVDPRERLFVAKTFTEDRSSVRYSAISFDDCHVSVVSNTGEETLGNNRIHIGILCYLPKFISMVERIGDSQDTKAQKEGDANDGFHLKIEYDTLMTKEGLTDFVGTEVIIESSKLRMNMKGFRVTEFKYLSDDRFKNLIFKVDDPIEFEMPGDLINSIVKTSDITKIDPQKDALEFYVDGKTVKVRSTLSGDDKNAPSGFDLIIAELPEEPSYPISATIFREKFVIMMNKCEDDYKVTIGLHKSVTEKPTVDRILFDSRTTNTKVVLSIVNE